MSAQINIENAGGIAGSVEPASCCTPEWRSAAFWYSDAQNAGAALVDAGKQFPPNDRLQFIKDAYLAAKVQLGLENEKAQR